jgi:hypothetical protein
VCVADALGHTAATGYELAIRSLGAVVWHLKYCLMDEELLSLRSFVKFAPVDMIETSDCSDAAPVRPAAFCVSNRHMVSDVCVLLFVSYMCINVISRVI